MFYLTFIGRLWARHPLKSACFILLGVALITLASHYSHLEGMLKSFYRVDPPGDSFHALVPGKQNAAWMARKLQELPGVRSVAVVPQDKLGAEIRTAVGAPPFRMRSCRWITPD
jgi:hypothetical protein